MTTFKAIVRIYQISVKTIRTWKLKLEYQGVGGLKHNHQNQHYSESEKKTLVKIFKSSNESALVFAVKHGISSDRSLREWVIKYNGSNLKGTIPRKRDFRSSPKCWCKLNSANLSFHKLKHTGFF